MSSLPHTEELLHIMQSGRRAPKENTGLQIDYLSLSHNTGHCIAMFILEHIAVYED